MPPERNHVSLIAQDSPGLSWFLLVASEQQPQQQRKDHKPGQSSWGLDREKLGPPKHFTRGPHRGPQAPHDEWEMEDRTLLPRKLPR